MMPTEERRGSSPDAVFSVQRRNAVAFFVLGLVNNFGYVVMLSAAEQILAGYAGVILACDIVPTFVVKLAAPAFAGGIPYHIRFLVCGLFAITSFFLVGFFENVGIRLLGVMVASAGAGLGEATALSATALYSDVSVVAWSSGTGFAGIAGAGWYLLFHDVLAWTPKNTLLLGSILPVVYLLVSYLVLTAPTVDPHDHPAEEQPAAGSKMDQSSRSDSAERPLVSHGDPPGDGDARTRTSSVPTGSAPRLRSAGSSDHDHGHDHDGIADDNSAPVLATEDGALEQRGASAQSPVFSSASGAGLELAAPAEGGTAAAAAGEQAFAPVPIGAAQGDKHSHGEADLWEKLRAVMPISRHMASMAAVYFLEYTVNTGVASTLGFPRDGVSSHVFYVRSNFAYQCGVFLSRTFGESVPMPGNELWPLPALQLVNLALFLAQSMTDAVKSSWVVLVVSLWVGMLGGTLYVKAFSLIRKQAKPHLREFSLGVASVADTTGIVLSSAVSSALEVSLNRYRARKGLNS